MSDARVQLDETDRDERPNLVVPAEEPAVFERWVQTYRYAAGAN